MSNSSSPSLEVSILMNSQAALAFWAFFGIAHVQPPDMLTLPLPSPFWVGMGALPSTLDSTPATARRRWGASCSDSQSRRGRWPSLLLRQQLLGDGVGPGRRRAPAAASVRGPRLADLLVGSRARR